MQAASQTDSAHTCTVIGPEESCTAPASTSTLLVIVPGAFLGPTDYSALAQALQTAACSKVRLWVGVVKVDWAAGSRDAPALDQVVREAGEMGFESSLLNSGRAENVVVALHSVSAVWAATYAKQCGGLVYLASNNTVSGQPGLVWNDVGTQGRAVLYLGGMADGQMKAALLAPQLLQAACMVPRFGLRYVAAHYPVVLLPSINHGHFSNGVPNVKRGDIAMPQPLAEAAAAIAAPLLNFVAANRAEQGSSVREAAIASLQEAAVSSAQLLAPYCDALGRGDPTQVWLGGNARPPADGSAVLPGGLISAAGGWERLPAGDKARPHAAHPGEVARAQQACEDVQRQMLAALPQEARGRVVVAATAHVDADTFTYSQPTVMQLPGGHTLVTTHVYLHRPAAAPGASYLPAPVAPIYYMKLKRAAVVEIVLGLRSEVAGNGGDGSQSEEAPGVSGSAASAAAYEAALAALPPAVEELFESRGRALRFVADRDVREEISSPRDWILEKDITITDVEERQVEVCAPFVATPSAVLPSYESGPGRFTGNWYIKCLSKAWCIEWCMSDGLRDKQLQPPKNQA